MKIVVLDAHPLNPGDLDWAPLEKQGSLTLYEFTRLPEVIARIQSAEVIYTNKVPITAEAIASAPSLKLISVLATGYDIVDVGAARQHGVTVCNVPGYSTASTAQTAIGLLLELALHLGEHDRSVHEGDWVRSRDFSYWKHPLVELEGKTLVIIGYGAIGDRVARIAAAMGMNIIIAQLPGREGGQPAPYPRMALSEALPRADAVTLHCPATPQTRQLVNATFLNQMKSSAFLINNGRGALVDEAALAHSLHQGHLAGYACDVLSTEPPSPDNPLLTAPRCIITPHLSWASRESRQRLLEASASNLTCFIGGTPQNKVN